MNIWRLIVRSRDWIALIAAIATGPLFVPICGRIPGISFASAIGFFFVYCAIAIPLVALIAKRWRFATWQIAVSSIPLTVFLESFWAGEYPRGDVVGTAYSSWVVAMLLSSPVPIYFLLRPLEVRWRIFFGIVIGAIVAAMFAGFRLLAK